MSESDIKIEAKKYTSILKFQSLIGPFLTRKLPCAAADEKTLYREWMDENHFDPKDDSLLATWFSNSYKQARRTLVANRVSEFLSNRVYDAKTCVEAFIAEHGATLDCTADQVTDLLDSTNKVATCKIPSLCRAIAEFDLVPHLHVQLPFSVYDEKTTKYVTRTASMWEILLGEFRQAPDIVAKNGMWWQHEISPGVHCDISVLFEDSALFYYYIVKVDEKVEHRDVLSGIYGDCSHAWDIELGEESIASSAISKPSFKTRQHILAMVKNDIAEKIAEHVQEAKAKVDAEQVRLLADARDKKLLVSESKQESDLVALTLEACLARNEWEYSTATHKFRSWTRANMTTVLKRLSECPLVLAQFVALPDLLETMAKIEDDRNRTGQMSSQDLGKIRQAVIEICDFLLAKVAK